MWGISKSGLSLHGKTVCRDGPSATIHQGRAEFFRQVAAGKKDDLRNLPAENIWTSGVLIAGRIL
jgi:hypothetical protein